MSRWALVNRTSGKVINIIEWDGTQPWEGPDNTNAVQDNGTAIIDGICVDGVFQPPAN